MDKDKLIAKLEKALGFSEADETEIAYIGTESGLTRFANSYIHQNVHENDRRIYFRAVLGRRVGVASTNSIVLDDLKKTAANAVEIARTQPENPNFPGLPKPAKYKALNTFDSDTARFGPGDRARVVKKVIAEAARKNFTVAGSCAIGSGEIAVLNSHGLRAYQPITSCAFSVIAMSDTSSGYAAGTSRHVADIDFRALARKAVDKCDRSQSPMSVEPGEYEVILEPPAIAEILEWLSWVSLGSKSFLQKTSFLTGKIGKKVTSDKISLYDNALDDRSNAFPFDFEGVPKKRASFISKGIGKGVVYDRASARRAKTKSTGHALPPDESSEGALPLNVFMAPGTAKREAMISKVKKGILVTRFHYINGLIDTRNSVMTGMTRDGTFLIENGEITRGIKNLRFTDSIMRALSSVVALSRETERVASWWSGVGCMTVPTLHLGSFKFSGKTEF